MPLSSKATASGATEDTARDFDHFHGKLVEKLAALGLIAQQLSEMKDSKTLTATEAKIQTARLHEQLAAVQREINTALANLVRMHNSAIAAKDKGSQANLDRLLASEDDADQFPLTRLVNGGVDAKAREIITLLRNLRQEYPFLPDRINEKPDPNVPSEGLKPTMEQAITHAVHEAVSSDNRDVLAELWQKIQFTKPEDYPPFLMELYEGAGYYRKPGSLKKLDPRPNTFKLITTKDYLPLLSNDQLNAVLMATAGHKSDTHKELEQLLEAVPENRRRYIDCVAALKVAAYDEAKAEIGNKKNAEVLLPHVSQAARDDIYKAVAALQPRDARAGIESPAAIEMAGMLLASAKKPLPADTITAIAKTGYATTLRHALGHATASELPGTLAEIIHPPSATSEANTLLVLKKIRDSHIVLSAEVLSATLDHAVEKGQLNLLQAVVDVPEAQPILNARETRSGHANEGGNRILFKAANYIARVGERTQSEKKADVGKALAMLKILHNEGRGAEIPVIHGARGRGVLNTISQRIAQDAPDLAGDDYLTLLKSRLDAQLAGNRAEAEETARLRVRGAYGLLGEGGNPVETRRLMLAQLTAEADAIGLTGEERKEHIRTGLASLTPQQPGRLALGSGTPSPASPPPPSVRRTGEPEALDVEIIPPPPGKS